METSKYFKELKREVKKVRGRYKDSPGDYYSEKIKMVDRIKMEEDAYIMINMFDMFNQRILWNHLSEGCRDYYSKEFEPMVRLAGYIDNMIK